MVAAVVPLEHFDAVRFAHDTTEFRTKTRLVPAFTVVGGSAVELQLCLHSGGPASRCLKRNGAAMLTKQCWMLLARLAYNGRKACLAAVIPNR